MGEFFFLKAVEKEKFIRIIPEMKRNIRSEKQAKRNEISPVTGFFIKNDEFSKNPLTKP
jgi:hypothetical protein